MLAQIFYSYDGIYYYSRCTEPRGTTETFNEAHMYVADAWHEPALATLNNLRLEQMVPVTGCTEPLACNYDARAAIDDGSCISLSSGYDCTGRRIDDGTGVTQFLRGPQTLSNDADGQQVHAMVDLPLDYTISFDLNPNGEIVDPWSSIVHFSATGNNCCEYGDRVPAVWFYPGSRRLHIIDGQPSVGNDECVIEEELAQGVNVHIEIAVAAESVVVSIDGVQRCTEEKTDRQTFQNVHVYCSDPWYEPAGATISDLKMIV